MSDRRSLAPYDRSTWLPSVRLVRTPQLARWFGRFLLFMVIATPFLLIFVPWMQTVDGRGEVIAFDPSEREQMITSRISGVIQKWHVNETDEVKAGDLLVDLTDNDAEYGVRLLSQRDFLTSRRKALLAQQTEQRGVVQAQRDSRLAAIDAAESLVRASEQSVEATRKSLLGAEALVSFEELRYKRFDDLFKNPLGGLEAELNVREAFNRWKRAEADVARIKEEIKRGIAAVKQAEAGVKRADADGLSAVATANGNLSRVDQDLFSLDRDMQVLDTTIERYNARSIRSPSDGVVLRIESDASQVGQSIKEGQVLAVIVPSTVDPVVSLYVSGVDAPLLQPDPVTNELPRVRVQFEGWPAVMFSGWPNASIGTFGGRVFRIDPTNNVQGQFRVLVRPEPHFDGDNWPDRSYLRQGNQAQGFLFLREVSLGYEVWRRLNGFPPVIPPTDAKKDKSGSKPPKVKVK